MFSQTEKSQNRNEEIAWNLLHKKVLEYTMRSYISNRTISDGEVEHIRTYKENQDRVTDHIDGNQMSLKHFKRGKIERIW